MKHTTRPPTATHRLVSAPTLGLSHVLADLLPTTVHSPGGPDRYEVNAVFTRRPAPHEIDAIDGAPARAWLDHENYPHVTLHASDRRLRIGNTNLDELSSGLATTLGRFLASISAHEATRARESADELAVIGEREQQRWTGVREHAAHIQFVSTGAGAGGDPLTATGIIAATLPPELDTSDAPARYTVTSALTRPPSGTEAALLTSAVPRQRLAAAGYPAAGIAMRDRLLEITGTTLDELEGGLAAAVADLLIDISAQAAQQDADTAAESARATLAEDQRLSSVRSAVAAISFAPGEAALTPDGVGDWEEEGGTMATASSPAE